MPRLCAPLALIPPPLASTPKRRRFTRRAWAGLALALASLTFPPDARGDAYEGFDYPTDATSLNGGSGFIGGGLVGSNDHRLGITPGSLSHPGGNLATGGNRIENSSGSYTWERRLEQVLGTPGTDVWVSWLQRRSENRFGFQGLRFDHTLPGGGIRQTYFIGEPGSGPGDNTYVIGQAGGDDFVVSSGAAVVPNETTFLVAHLQFRDGNDLATLFVNPTPGLVEPAGGVTYSALDVPVSNPVVTFIGTAIGTGVAHAFDELRVGNSYASVAPVPEPGAAAAVFLVALAAARRRRR